MAGHHQLHRRVVLTGYTIVSKTWRVQELGFANKMIMRGLLNGQCPTLSFKKVTYDDLKGVKELHGRAGILISWPTEVFRVKGHEKEGQYVLITGALSSDGSTSAKTFDDLKVVIQAEFCRAVNDALSSFERHEIGVDQVVRFGDVFQEHFNRQLEFYSRSSVLVYMSGFYPWLTGKEWGVTEVFDGFKLAYADQVIVEFSYAFEKNMMCLLWKASSIVGCYPGEITEFYNFCTGGHGGFLIDFKTLPDNARKLDAVGVHSISANFCTNFYYGTAQLFPHGISWMHPRLQQSLTALPGRNYDGVPAGDWRYELVTIMNCLDHLSSFGIWVNRSRDNSINGGNLGMATFTATMLYTPNAGGMPHASNQEILRSIYNEFRKEYPAENITSKIAEFPMSDMANQVKTTLMMAVNTLKPVLQEANLARTNEPVRLSLIPNFRNLQSVLVCEAIISFCIYGRMNVCSKGNKFAAPFYETLGLVPENFRNRTATFEGLRALRYITVTGQSLSYVGPFFPTTYFLEKGIEKEDNKGDPSTSTVGTTMDIEDKRFYELLSYCSIAYI